MTEIMKTESSFAAGRGTTMEIARTLDGHQALQLGGIDWQIQKVSLADYSGHDVKNGTKHFVSVRSSDGAIVGVNGKRHALIQNDVLAGLGDAVRRFRPDATYVAGGASKTGELCFLMLELDDPLVIPGTDGNDTIRKQILIGTGHNGNSHLFASAVSHRLACMNQWAGMMGGQKRLVEVRHTTSASQNVEIAKRLLQEQVAQFDEIDRELQRLLEVKVPVVQPVLRQMLGARPDEAGRTQTFYDQRFDAIVAEYVAPWNQGLYGSGLGVVMAAQGVDEHGSRCKTGERQAQRLGRLVQGSYPLMTRALAVVG